MTIDDAIMAVHQRGREKPDEILIAEICRLRMAVRNMLGLHPAARLDDDVVGLCAVGRIDDARRLATFSNATQIGDAS